MTPIPVTVPRAWSQYIPLRKLLEAFSVSEDDRTAAMESIKITFGDPAVKHTLVQLQTLNLDQVLTTYPALCTFCKECPLLLIDLEG